MDEEIINNDDSHDTSKATTTPTPPHDGATDPSQDKLAAVERERDEYLAGWQRSKADFMNYKKEESQKLEEVSQYATAGIIKDIISVLDTFDIAVRTLEKAGPVEKGIYLIRSQMEEVLRRRGVEKINVSPGNVFDPSIAEALSEIDSDHPPGTIVEEIEPGYRLHEKIIKPVRVVISKDKE